MIDRKDIIDMQKVIAECTPATVDLKIPDGVTEIKPYAYRNGTDLRTIAIPASVTEIGEYAFANCSDLDTVYCPQGLERKVSKALQQCAKLPALILR